MHEIFLYEKGDFGCPEKAKKHIKGEELFLALRVQGYLKNTFFSNDIFSEQLIQ